MLVLMLSISVFASCALQPVNNGNSNSDKSDKDDKDDDDSNKDDDSNNDDDSDKDDDSNKDDDSGNDDGTTDDGNDDGTTDDGNDDGTTDDGKDDGTTDDGKDDGTTDDGKDDGTTDDGKDDGTGEDIGEVIENMIYNSTSALNIVVGSNVKGALALKLSEELFFVRDEMPVTVNDEAAPIEHEIILGATSRDLTATAMMRLNRMIEDYQSADESCYIIYSDGSSIAIVFDDDYDGVAQQLAIEHFLANYVRDSFAHPAGIVDQVKINLIDDYYTPKDEARRNTVVEAAREKLGNDTVNALLSMASLYDIRLVEWMAGLYDPCICVCVGLGEEECQNTKYCKAQGGGFYFSNSARDNIGYLPDLESTRQALDMLNMSGMTWMYGGNYYSGALPSEMLQAIGRYTQVLQSSSDGYFRHPQWAHLADYDMRLNRDLSWATTLLNAAGMRPYYTTPTGITGMGAPSDTANELTPNLGESSVSAVSKVVAVASYPAILESVDTFKAFLATLDKSIRTSSYGTGSRLSTYSAQIQARDRSLGGTPLMDTLIEWLNGHMNPERGTWVWDEANGGISSQMGKFAETNGVMKICGIYGAAKAAWPNGLKCMETCVEVLTGDEVATGGVDVYNAWTAIRGVYSCVVNYNSLEEQEAAKEFMSNFRQNATDAVIASRDKLANFKREDGSFSYSPTGGSGVSMGMPTQVKGTSEGDVNGALIASVDCWERMSSALGITKIPIFGSAEMHHFRKLIADADPVIKQGANFDYTVVDFEDDEVGEEPLSGVTFGKASTVGALTVAYDEEKNTNYLEFVTGKASSGDTLRVTCESKATTAAAFVFEGDLCVKEASYEYMYQIQIGSIGYLIQLKKSGNKVKLIEASSDDSALALNMDLGADINMGDWFRLKVIYFLGDHDTVRIKVYFDNLSDGEDELQLLAVSDNYYDKNGDKFNGKGKPSTTYTHAAIYAYASLEGTMLLDNLAAYRSKDVYTQEADPDNQPLYNVDPPDSPAKTYDFEDEALSEDITVKSGEVSISDGELHISSKTELSLPINMRTAGSKCATVSFDLTAADAKGGTNLLTITLSEPLGKMFTLIFRVAEDEAGKYIACVEKNEAEGATISGVRISATDKNNIRVDYHHDEDVALIYVNEEFVGASGTIYKGANRRTVRTLTVSTSTSTAIALDNLVFEKNLNSYDEATKPNKDSVIYDFEDGAKDETMTGGASIVRSAHSGSWENVAKLVYGSTPAVLSVPINHRANLYSLLTLEAKLYFESAQINGDSNMLSVKDYDGNTIFAIAIKVNGNLIELYEVGGGGIASSRIASFDKSKIVNLKVLIYPEDKMVHFYIDGVCVAKSSVFADTSLLSARPASFEIATSTVKSTLLVDNVKAETIYEIYQSVTAKGEGNTGISNPLDFEKSSTGSLPAGIIKSAQNFRVENLFNTITGEYSNVGVMDTIRGRNEKIGVSLGAVNTESCVTFETDLMISGAEYDYITQIFFTDKNNEPSKGSIYGLVISKSSNGFIISDYTAAAGRGTTLVSGLSYDTWYKLKLEYFVLENGEARMKVYINGELKYVSDRHYEVSSGASPRVDVKSVMFYTFQDSKCSIYVDNMSLTSSDATCDDTVGKK